MTATRPTGTVTFLFTDIEGSTRLWDEHPEGMKPALARHDEIVRGAIETEGGYVFATGGDGFAAAFHTPDAAVDAAIAAQRQVPATSLQGVEIKVRMGIHTGTAEERDGDYFGGAVNRAARLMAAGHGGQVLVSGASADVLDTPERLVDLGRYRLRDLSTDERVFQLGIDGLESSFPVLRTADTLPGNLPRQLTSFVGRAEELQDVAGRVMDTPLVTLTGVGGVGKTRLALEVAAAVQTEFPDGTWLVELAPVSDPDQIPARLAGALGLRPGSGVDPVQAVLDVLRTRKLLVVLDNCEHLIAAAEDLVARVLENCPTVKILATSREGLGHRGEALISVPSLRVTPPAGDDGGAVELFVNRAVAVRPDFDLTAEQTVVEELCNRLDGIPLAIELAAARMRAMTATEILDRLDERFRLLTGRDRKALERHQTLRGTVDWSYELLDDSERSALRRLAVFIGGCSIEAAEAVVAGDGIDSFEVLDLLQSLVDKSLLSADATDGRTRYRMLETIRQYAEEKLAESGDNDVVRRRHAGYYTHLATRECEALCGPEEPRAKERIAVDFANIRGAILWAADAREFDLALTAAAAFTRPFMALGPEEVELGPAVLRASPPIDHPALADVVALSCWYAYYIAEPEALVEPEALLDQLAPNRSAVQRRILALARGILATEPEFMLAELEQVVSDADAEGDDYTAAGAQTNISFAHWFGLDFEAGAVTAAERSRCPSTLAIGHFNLGMSMQYGDYSAALKELDLAIAYAREARADIALGCSLVGAAMVLARQGRIDDAIDPALEALRLYSRTGDLLNLGYVTTGVGLVLAHAGHPSASDLVRLGRDAIAPSPNILVTIEEVELVTGARVAPTDAVDIMEMAARAEEALLELEAQPLGPPSGALEERMSPGVVDQLVAAARAWPGAHHDG